MINKLRVTVICFLLVACTSTQSSQISKHPEVVFLDQEYSFLKECDRLGRISSTVKVLSFTAILSGLQSKDSKTDDRAIIRRGEKALKQAAYEKYKADTVLRLGVDSQFSTRTYHGMAYKCNS